MDINNYNTLTSEDVSQMISSLGIERIESNVLKASERGQISTTKTGQVMLDTAINRFSKSLQDWLKIEKHRCGPKHGCAKYLELLKTDVIAFITSQIVIDNITISNALQGAALSISNALEEEVRFNAVRRAMPAEWKKLTRRWNFSHEGHKRRVIKAAVNRIDTTWQKWPIADKYTLGFFLLELFANITGFIELITISVGPKKRKTIVRPTQELIKWYADNNDDIRAKYPFYLPLVQEPEDWTSPQEGGYPKNIIMRWPLVHQYNKKAKKQEYADIPEVYDAVNSLQKVPWRINEFVWEVFNHYWQSGQKVADIPGGGLIELPEVPVDFKTNEDSKKAWKKKAHAIYNSNARLGSKKTLYGKIHFIARHYGNQNFWFPYKLDFRGRAYPIPAFLNPQGCPLAKGLLKFAKGKKIQTDEARGWFYIHGANTWGQDKVSFEKRIAWVLQHHNEILEVYNDPLSNRWWEDADSPWQFLAWCEEYGKLHDNPDELSYIPVAMDGTNNGLQIYSLLLRDPVGAAATNVSPSDNPRDIYQEIADLVTVRLRNETDEIKICYARDWLSFCNGSIPRSATKRPVMVLPYGGTPYSIRLYVQDWYEDEIYKRNLEFDRPFGTTFKHTKYLTDLILEAIAEVLVGAVKGMVFFREVAKIATERRTPLVWKTPTGFEIFQASLNYNRVSIRTQLGKIHRKRTIIIPNEDLSLRGQTNGLPPNNIHGIDAAVMTKTTNACVQDDIVDLAMVHDSFATHAANCPAMARHARETVVNIFGNHNLLEEFKNQISKLLPGVELPNPPALGDLDINSVLESKYFFA